MPETLHRMDEDSVRRYREHDGEVSDEHDAARKYEAEDGRCATPGEDAGYLAGIGIACIALIAIVSAVYTHRDVLLGWLR